MNQISIAVNELTGARITIPFTALKRFGPKHHAIVLGFDPVDHEIWIAELSRRFGYRLVALKTWLQDNCDHLDGLKIELNSGPRTSNEIARSAIQEVQARCDSEIKYNVLFNNCETFANRQINGKTTLSPQIKMAVRMLGFAVAGGALILRHSLTRRFLF